MPTYVSLLRGINVSGHKIVKMDRLRELYAGLGFDAVKTYVQSGNVVFDTPRTGATALSEKIVRQIEKQFGYSVSVVIRTPRDLVRILKNNPFLGRRDVDPAKLCVAFLAGLPGPAGLDTIQALDSGADEWHLAGKEIYLHCPGGFARTKLSNNYLERALSVTATTRNWKTVNALCELSRGN